MIHDKNFPFHEPEDETEIIHVGHGHGRGVIGKTIVAVIVAVGIFYGAKALFDLGKGDSYEENGMAVIEPNPEPYKVAPESPGGMKIPHMDKEIYGRLKMPIEEPIDIYDQAEFESDPIQKAMKQEENYTKEVMKLESYSERKASNEPPPSKTESKVIRIDAKGREIQSDSSKVITVGTQSSKAKRIDVEKVLAKRAANEIWLQLGSFKMEEEATKAWQDAREKNSDILKDLTIKVTKSDMKEQGTLYRLQAGPVEDEQAAKQFCVKLNERKQSCFFTTSKN